jgi:hypothetical protein
MEMTKGEIIADYKQAKHKAKHVQTLADLNACPVSEIKAILYEAGLIDAEPVVPEHASRKYVVWLPEDDEAMREMFLRGCKDRNIAEALGRTPAAVAERRRVLGLLREKNNKPAETQTAAPVADIAPVVEAVPEVMTKVMTSAEQVAEPAPAAEEEQVIEAKPAELPKITGTTLDAVDVTPAVRRAEVLDKAKQCVCSERNEQYGEPEDNFAVIASLWETYIKARCVGEGVQVDITARDVAIMMVLFKVGRAATSIDANDDTLVDIAGYAACAAGMA